MWRQEESLPRAAIFDSTARCWTRAESVITSCSNNQMGMGGDQLVPAFLSPREQDEHGPDLEEWRSRRVKSKYLSLIRFDGAKLAATGARGRSPDRDSNFVKRQRTRAVP